MSKQLAISASASIFSMAAFALFASPLGEIAHQYVGQKQGAETEVAAPTLDRVTPGIVRVNG